MLDAAILSTHKFRFQANAPLVDLNVGSADLIDMLATALTATTAASLINALRLKRVSIWAPPAQDLVPVTCSVEFTNNAASGLGQRPRVFSDTSVGATRVASVSVAPPPGSGAAMWQNRFGTGTSVTSGLNIILNGPENSIVDFDLELVLQNNDAFNNAIVTTGAFPGRLYCRSIDTALIPVSFPQLP